MPRRAELSGMPSVSRGAEIDFRMQVVGGDSGQQFPETVITALYGLQNDAAVFQPDFDVVFYVQAQGLECRCGQPDGCAVTPFFYDSTHVFSFVSEVTSM